MKHIAIISAGLLPVPAIKGGAVESLIDVIISENEERNDFNITIFSIYDERANEISQKYNNCTIKYVKINKITKKIWTKISKIINKTCKNNIFKPNILYIKKVCNMLKNSKFDYIIIENDVDFVIPVSKITKSPVLLHIHNDYLNCEIPGSKKIIKHCSKVIVVSNYIRNRVLTLGKKENEKKVCVLKNCTDINKFNKDLYYDFRESFRRKNNILDDDIVIMFSGRIDPTKGIRELIKAFKQINSNKCKLLIVGSSWYGMNNKTNFTKEIEKMCENIKDKIIFTGFIPFCDMPKMHSIADIAVIPSIWEEPAGLVVIEAMSSGLPTIVTNVGGIREYTSKDSVVMIENNKDIINNLANVLEKLIQSKEKRDYLSKNARLESLKYNKKSYYDKFIDIVGDL